MKKATVIGGSNGIGLAITKKLVDMGYCVNVLDIREPEKELIPEASCCYHYFDMLEVDEDLISSFAKDEYNSVLMITAGIGRIADFEYWHSAEIYKTMTINATSTIQVLRLFYDRLLGDKSFYCGVMGSISGFLSSPSAAVYAASKAAICRFVESVNIELEVSGTSNRVLNISPASFKGSRFYGGCNQVELLYDLADGILANLFSSSQLYIPKYEEMKAVIDRYNMDPHEYGIHSYMYKKESGRLDNNRRVRIGYLSGTFDLFHVGHLNLLKRAKHECDYLIVGVHESGAWKGKETFIPFDERKQIVAACKYVDKVVDSCREDSDAWFIWHYDILFVGSDYKGTERFHRYEEFFKDKGVSIMYFPYTKSTSSTQIRKTIGMELVSDEGKSQLDSSKNGED